MPKSKIATRNAAFPIGSSDIQDPNSGPFLPGLVLAIILKLNIVLFYATTFPDNNSKDVKACCDKAVLKKYGAQI